MPRQPQTKTSKHRKAYFPLVLSLPLIFGIQPVIVGWAKPVPINPYNFKDQKWGPLKVAVSGPASNIIVALIFGLLIRFIPSSLFISAPGLFLMFAFTVWINMILAIFNLLPIPPLDGSWILFNFLPSKYERVKMFLQQYGLFILIALIFFGGLSRLGDFTRTIFYFIAGTPSPF